MNSKDKIKVLANFGYYRKGWIAPLEALDPGKFELVYLYYISPNEELERCTSNTVIYWSQYTNAFDLIQKVRPNRIVFMTLASGLGITLNMAAKKMQIPTFILQHGLYSNYKDYRNREKLAAKIAQHPTPNAASGDGKQVKFASSSFIFTTLKHVPFLDSFFFILYVLLLRKVGAMKASRIIRFNGRTPGEYIVFTERNARIHEELDGKGVHDKLRVIGNPELDMFLVNDRELINTYGEYFLLIDQPFAENRFNEHIVSKQEAVEFYKKLGQYALSKGAKLVIKLHPESYRSNWLPAGAHIIYVRECDNMNALIKNSMGCFGSFSTLMIPAAFFRPTILFKVTYSVFIDHMEELGLVKVLDYKSFEIEDIHWKGAGEHDQREQFIKDYFYKPDGRCINRLERVLIHPG